MTISVPGRTLQTEHTLTCWIPPGNAFGRKRTGSSRDRDKCSTKEGNSEISKHVRRGRKICWCGLKGGEGGKTTPIRPAEAPPWRVR